MRKLTQLEISMIHARLKSLYIRYTEVYEEIFDHYSTTLENTPATDSAKEFAKLNETFAWSVVKRMDKELEKCASLQLWKAQLEFLKFWNHGLKGFLIVLTFILIISAVVVVFPSSELFFLPVTLIFLVVILINHIKGYGNPFSLKHKTLSVQSKTVLNRISAVGNILIWINFIPFMLMEKATPTQIHFSSTLVITNMLITIYAISIFAIATDLPKPRFFK